MFNAIHQNLVRPSLITYSLLGVCLTLVSTAPIQAQPQYDFNSQYQYSQNSETYLVIVDSNDTRVLDQVRSVERTAFRRNFQGRFVIQAGKFNSFNNAQERVRELQAYGVGSRLYTQSNGQEVAVSNTNYPNSTNRPDYVTNNPKQKTKYYYVAIPEKPEKLIQISNQIRQSAGGNSVGVAVRNSPRGPHVAVGPFGGRLQAEQWNYYIRSLGLNDARVYYGK
ncbi:hypothetical protein [Rivularia sp. UHCC 0363]|uniref:hypothetical protein n=1 Tax=Rivularia sp. UHCC 0363 TaxID=3110244 RepID=UPI002B20A927|nr:hypothetical protein [Rivularia sp. UHCC 0363]MEA5597512.1 hypothetical protein [Rivularia sp. UHCC 0363]